MRGGTRNRGSLKVANKTRWLVPATNITAISHNLLRAPCARRAAVRREADLNAQDCVLPKRFLRAEGMRDRKRAIAGTCSARLTTFTAIIVALPAGLNMRYNYLSRQLVQIYQFFAISFITKSAFCRKHGNIVHTAQPLHHPRENSLQSCPPLHAAYSPSFFAF